MHNLVMDAHYEFLALVRDPIDRARAAWAYGHPKNAHFRRSPNHHTAAVLEMKNAFMSASDDLASDGLGGAPWKDPCPFLARESFENINDLSRHDTNQTQLWILLYRVAAALGRFQENQSCA